MSKAYVSVALRRLVYDRANSSCEYCLMPEIAAFISHQIDHVIAEKHGGKTEADNLALACTICNKYKGSDLTFIEPSNGEIVRLYHPRQDCWNDHFQWDAGKIVPVIAIGSVTIRLLQINRDERVVERQLLWEAKALKLPS